MRLWLSISVLISCLPTLPAKAMLPDAPQPQIPGPQITIPAKPVTPVNYQSLPHINQREADQSDDQLNPAVFSHHLIADRIWISGQANFIFQAHTPFHSPYAGPNSFQSRVEMTALSRLLTLYTGVKLARWTEFIFDAEEAGERV